MLIGLAFLACTRQAQTATADPLITLSNRAENIQKILEEVTAQSHIDLHVSEPLLNEVMAINVVGVPVSVVMAKIATAEYSDWEKSGSGYYLVINQQKEQAEQTLYTKQAAKNIQKQLDEEIKSHVTQDDNGDDAATENEISSSAAVSSAGPISIAASFGGSQIDPNLLNAIGAETLAEIQPGDRVVFSTQPTSMQIPFPEAAESRVETAGGKIRVNKKPVALSKAIMVIEEDDQYFSMGLSATLNFYNGKGEVVRSEHSFINSQNLDIPTHNSGSSPTKLQGDTSKKDILLPTDTSEIESMSDPAKVAKMKSFSPALLRQFETPTEFDPLSYSSDYLLGAAKAENENMIAALPDTFLTTFGLKSTNSITYLDDLSKSEKTKLTRSEKWIEVSSSEPSFTRKDRIDRTSLQKFLLYAASHPVADVDVFAQLAVGMHGKASQFLAYAVAIVQPAYSMTMFTQNWKILAIYGSLLADQKAVLNNSGSILTVTVPSDASQMVQKMVYGAGVKLYQDPSPNAPTKKPAPEDIFMTMFGQNSTENLAPAGLGSEPTEVAPNGLPEASTVAGKISKSVVYRMVPKDKENLVAKEIASLALKPSEIAMFLSMDEIAPQASASIPAVSGLTQGNRTELTLRIYLAAHTYVSGTISQDYFDPNTSMISIEKLPDDIKSAKANFAKIMKDSLGHLGTPTTSGP